MQPGARVGDGASGGGSLQAARHAQPHRAGTESQTPSGSCRRAARYRPGATPEKAATHGQVRRPKKTHTRDAHACSKALELAVVVVIPAASVMLVM